MNISNVKLKLLTTKSEIISRTIDISNVMILDSNDDGLKLASIKNQEQLLLEWIETRGNEQHNDVLILLDWELI